LATPFAIAAASSGDTIVFAIPEAGVQTISVLTPLGPLAAGVTLDATTQSGANCATWPPVLTVEIQGDSAPGGTHGITIGGNGVVVRGLVVNSFPGDGIHFANGASGATIACNFVGTDTSGTLDYGNAGIGIALANSSNTAIEGNLISANAIAGVAIDGASQGVALRKNYIGTDVGGGAALGNLNGVVVSGPGNTIGGAALGNVISGNYDSGIAIDGALATGNSVYGNEIGENAAGNASLPNGGSGVYILNGASQNVVGSATPGEGNVLRGNGVSGVWVTGATSIGNAVRGNSTLLNDVLGIDLGAAAATPNDQGDPDSGSNRLQNTPDLTDVAVAANQVAATFTVSTSPLNAAYPLLIDFYIADADFEEGQTYVGTTSYSGADYATGEVSKLFTAAAPLVGGNDVVATATDSAGNTSEFTAFSITVTPEPGAFACELTAVAILASRRRRR
jgi:parallel beta-helix repeat protein